MCGGGDQVGVVKGRRDGLGRHQAADVGHVSEQVGVDVRAQLQRDGGGRHRQREKLHVFMCTLQIVLKKGL